MASFVCVSESVSVNWYSTSTDRVIVELERFGVLRRPITLLLN